MLTGLRVSEVKENVTKIFKLNIESITIVEIIGTIKINHSVLLRECLLYMYGTKFYATTFIYIVGTTPLLPYMKYRCP